MADEKLYTQADLDRLAETMAARAVERIEAAAPAIAAMVLEAAAKAVETDAYISSDSPLAESIGRQVCQKIAASLRRVAADSRTPAPEQGNGGGA